MQKLAAWHSVLKSHVTSSPLLFLASAIVLGWCGLPSTGWWGERARWIAYCVICKSERCCCVFVWGKVPSTLGLLWKGQAIHLYCSTSASHSNFCSTLLQSLLSRLSRTHQVLAQQGVISQSWQDWEPIQNAISEANLKEEDIKPWDMLWERKEGILQESIGEKLLHYVSDKQKSRNTCTKLPKSVCTSRRWMVYLPSLFKTSCLRREFPRGQNGIFKWVMPTFGLNLFLIVQLCKIHRNFFFSPHPD